MSRSKSTPALSVYEAALRQIEGLTELDAAIELADLIPDLAPQPIGNSDAEFEAALERALDEVRAGRPIPADIAEKTVLLNAAPERLRLTAVIRDRAIGFLAGERTNAFLRGADHALDYLADQLNQLLGDVLTVTGRPEHDDETLSELASRYDEIRRAQFEITNRAIKDRGDRPRPQVVAAAGIYRDSVASATFWSNRRKDEAARSNPTTAAADAYVAWLRSAATASYDPAQVVLPGRVENDTGRMESYQQASRASVYQTVPTTSPWWPTTDRIGHLTHAARTNRLWLPSTRDLINTYDAAFAATTRVIGRLNTDRTDARTRYYELTGIDDPENLQPDRDRDTTPRNVDGQPLPKPHLTKMPVR